MPSPPRSTISNLISHLRSRCRIHHLVAAKPAKPAPLLTTCGALVLFSFSFFKLSGCYCFFFFSVFFICFLPAGAALVLSRPLPPSHVLPFFAVLTVPYHTPVPGRDQCGPSAPDLVHPFLCFPPRRSPFSSPSSSSSSSSSLLTRLQHKPAAPPAPSVQHRRPHADRQILCTADAHHSAQSDWQPCRRTADDKSSHGELRRGEEAALRDCRLRN